MKDSLNFFLNNYFHQNSTSRQIPASGFKDFKLKQLLFFIYSCFYDIIVTHDKIGTLFELLTKGHMPSPIVNLLNFTNENHLVTNFP